MKIDTGDSCGGGARVGPLSGFSEASKPKVADVHLFREDQRAMVLTVPNGQILEVRAPFDSLVEKAMGIGDGDRVKMFLAAAGIEIPKNAVAAPPTGVPVRALSLAIAQRCNLGCNYCYAQQGSFGGTTAIMTVDVAKRAVERLFEGLVEGDSATLAFMGGEPLINRRGIKAVTHHASMLSRSRGVTISYAMTTNGTLVTREDAQFLNEYAFTVTFSLDGIGAAHDRLRCFKSGGGTYNHTVRGALSLLGLPDRRCKVLARVSVTPENMDLPTTFLGLVDLGFDGIMFSPVLHAPSGVDQMGAAQIERFLEQMIRCGDIFWHQLRDGRLLPYSNVIATINRLHCYRPDAYPCGAGGGYVGVSAGGGVYSCHRFVDDPVGELGHVDTGVEPGMQKAWLESRHLNKQSPCGSCWARYLCNGGCHYEAVHEGRIACDYIRGWLHYCLGHYTRLRREDRTTLERILGAVY